MKTSRTGFIQMRIWASLMAQMVKNLSAIQETQVQSLGQGDPLEKENGYPLQYSGLENPVDREPLWAQRGQKSQTQLRDFHFQGYNRKATSGCVRGAEMQSNQNLRHQCSDPQARGLSSLWTSFLRSERFKFHVRLPILGYLN